MTPTAKSSVIKELGRSIGFDRVGITRAEPIARGAYYRAWLASGYAGSMAYLHENQEARADPRRLLPEARSAICVAVSYRPTEEMPPSGSHGETGRVARYARGRDYHTVLHDMLGELLERMKSVFEEPFQARICVDTMPLLERELAHAAGVGWIGKNTIVLHERLGSYLCLGEALTSLELEPDAFATDHCGNCTRCLDACPTRAFPAPYQLDASRYISYLTVEHRGEFSRADAAAIDDWVFGCDICQEVCPFNAKAPPGTQPAVNAPRTPARLDLARLARMTAGDYRRLTKDSTLRRATRKMLLRNARVALENARLRQSGGAAHAEG